MAEATSTAESQRSSTKSPMMLGVVGCGNMGGAIVRGIIREWPAGSVRVLAFDTDPQKSHALHELPPVTPVDDLETLVEGTEVLLLATKPGAATKVLQQVATFRRERASRANLPGSLLIVSVAAGVVVADLAAAIDGLGRVARAMPNLPCLVGAGCVGIYAETEEDRIVVERIFAPLAHVFPVTEERDLDVVTALGASGPAFVAVTVEALADGAVRMGLPRETAHRMAVQMVRGTAEYLLETGIHPAALKDAVASPAGTTMAGLRELERGGLRSTILDAIEAAVARSRGLR